MAREGICLLLMATPLALLIEAQFVRVGFLDIPKGTLPELYWPAILPLRFLLVNILTWILLAIVILARRLASRQQGRRDGAGRGAAV